MKNKHACVETRLKGDKKDDSEWTEALKNLHFNFDLCSTPHNVVSASQLFSHVIRLFNNFAKKWQHLNPCTGWPEWGIFAFWATVFSDF
jgi:hypothetical protein